MLLLLFVNNLKFPLHFSILYTTWVWCLYLTEIKTRIFLLIHQELPLWVRVDLGVMAMKEYSRFPKALVIISSSWHQPRYPWPYLATPPYRSSLPVGPQGYTPYPHRAAVCRFELVALLLVGHVKGSIGVHHLWARPYFSSSVLHVWFIWLGYFSWWVVGGRTAAALWVLPPGLVQYCSQHSCEVAIKLFLQPFS